jgi:antitoxin HigA-1
MTNRLDPVHPGEVLFEEFLKPMGISQNKLAMCLRVPSTRINDIVHGKRSITADTALRLAQFFGNSAKFWLNLQQSYDLDKTTDELGDGLAEEVRPYESVHVE